MRAAVLSFSERGAQTAKRVAEALRGEYEIRLYAPRGNLSELTGELFRSEDALIFVGACGIAVRAIAPYVADKTSDPAVLVLDELALHVISLLSGHIGGANALCWKRSLKAPPWRCGACGMPTPCPTSARA